MYLRHNIVFALSIIESIYLLYMFFIFKTKYSIKYGLFDERVQTLGNIFIHDTNKYENKICIFGKIMAIISIFFLWTRYLIKDKYTLIYLSISYLILCVILSLLMNMNAFIYIIPLIIIEIYIMINIFYDF